MLFEEFRVEDYGDVRYQNGLLDAVVNVIKTLRITLTDAMNVVKLDQKYRNQVIEELRKQNITYKE